MLVRWNRFGRFLGCSGYPECKSTRSLDGFNPEGEELGVHPEHGHDIRLKYGPYGPYVEMDTGEDAKKPKRASLPKGVEPQDVDLPYALKLLELPRTVGEDPKTGEEIVAGLGRFGPFVRRGKTFASLPSHEALWTVTVDQAAELIEAKASGRRVPLKELGKHPKSGAELTVHAGRYGPYVTDGDVNATLPKGTEPEDVDLETAVQLIDEKAAKGGGKRKKRGAKAKAPARKAARKPRKKKS
jgi:DNA topoisomerase I